MILEPVVMATDFLMDPVNGVNAQLRRITLLADDDRPAAIDFIGDEFRDDCVARAQTPPSTPALYVMRDGPVVLQGDVQTVYRYGDGPVGLAVRLFTIDPTTTEAARAVEYYLRAIVRSLAVWLTNEQEAARDLNDIQVLGCDRVVWSPMKESIGSAMVTGAVALSLNVRDVNPLS